jgi:hypothetical protein
MRIPTRLRFHIRPSLFRLPHHPLLQLDIDRSIFRRVQVRAWNMEIRGIRQVCERDIRIAGRELLLSSRRDVVGQIVVEG